MATSCLFEQIDALVQDCGNSNALAVELLQSSIKPSKLMKMDPCRNF